MTRWGIYFASYDFLSLSDVCRLAPAEICAHYALRDFLQAEIRDIREQQENLYFWWLQFDPIFDPVPWWERRSVELNPAYALDMYLFFLPYVMTETERNNETARLQSIFTDCYPTVLWSEQEEEAWWSDDDHSLWEPPSLYTDSD